MATTTAAEPHTDFGCDLRVRATCTDGADTVVTTREGLAFSCRACAEERAELTVALGTGAGEPPF